MIRADREALLAFAEAIRGEEWAAELSLAIVAVTNAGWEWERIGRHACRLIFTGDAVPRDLAEAARDPLRPAAVATGAPPASVAGDLAAARARAEAASERYRQRVAADQDGGAA